MVEGVEGLFVAEHNVLASITTAAMSAREWFLARVTSLMARAMLTAFEGLLADAAGVCPTLLGDLGGSASIAAGIHGVDRARDCKSFHEFRVLAGGAYWEEFGCGIWVGGMDKHG